MAKSKTLRSASTLLVLFFIMIASVAWLHGSKSVVFGSGGIIVVQPGQSIAQAVNSASAGDTILVKSGLYAQSMIVVNTTVSIVGQSAEGTVVDGSGQAQVLFQVVADNVLIENLTLQNTSMLVQAPAVRFYGVTGARVLNVTARNAGCGVELLSSNFTEIGRCRVSGCSSAGINLREGSSNNVVVGNTIRNSSRGIVFADTASQFNRIYHNNFENNTRQIDSLGGINYFDDGYPSGGNYWSDYLGSDLKSGSGQDQSGSDGIFDQGFSFDNYPLANPITNMDIQVPEGEFNVQASTNSTVTRVGFDASERSLDLFVTPDQGPTSVLRVQIPKDLLSCEKSSDWIVHFQQNGSTSLQYLCMVDAENTYLYFSYGGMEEGEIQITGTTVFPELSPLALTAIFLVVTLFLSILISCHPRAAFSSERQGKTCLSKY